MKLIPVCGDGKNPRSITTWLPCCTQLATLFGYDALQDVTTQIKHETKQKLMLTQNCKAIGERDIQSPPYPTVTEGMGCARGVSSLPKEIRHEDSENILNLWQLPGK